MATGIDANHLSIRTEPTDMDETDESRSESDASPRSESMSPDADDETEEYYRQEVEAVVEDVDGVEYEEGNVAGPSPTSDLGSVEPGAPTLEGSVFVLLGVVLTVVVLAQLVGL